MKHQELSKIAQMPRIIGYKRTFFPWQDLNDQLAGREFDELWEDEAYAGHVAPKFNQMVDELQAGDVVVVQDSRWFGDTIGAIVLHIEDIVNTGAGYRDIVGQFQIGPSQFPEHDPVWKALLHLRQGAAENSAERRLNGIKKAQAADKYSGRKKQYNPDVVLELEARGLTNDQIAEALGAHPASIFRIRADGKKEYGLPPRGKFVWVSLEHRVELEDRLNNVAVHFWDVAHLPATKEAHLELVHDKLRDQGYDLDQIGWFLKFYDKDISGIFNWISELQTGKAEEDSEDELRRGLLLRRKLLKIDADQAKDLFYRFGPPSFDRERARYLAHEGNLDVFGIAECMKIPESAVWLLLKDTDLMGGIMRTEQAQEWLKRQLKEELENQRGIVADPRLQMFMATDDPKYLEMSPSDPRLQAPWNDPLDPPFET